MLYQLWRLHRKRMYENIKIVERRPSFSLDICSILNAPLKSSFDATRKTDAKVPFPIKYFILSIFLFVSRHFLIVSKWNAFTFIIYLYRSKGFFIQLSPKVTLHTFFTVLIVPELLVLTDSFKAPYQLLQKFFLRHIKCIQYEATESKLKRKF